MKKIKKFITVSAAATLCMLFLCLTPAYAAERPISVYLNGMLVEFDITNGVRDQALTLYDYAYVPIARIVELLTGSRPVWDDYAKTSTYNYNGKRYVIDTRQNGIYVDGAFVASVTGTPPVIVSDRMMIPLKMLSATMGFGQRYDPATHSTWLTPPVTTSTPVPATPIPVVTQPQIPVAITGSEINKTTANVGDSVTVTVKTTKSANNVWINDGAVTYEAIYAWEDANGIKTWVLNYKVSVSANLLISANTSRDASGAAVSNLAISVSTPVPTPSPTPTPVPGTYSGIIQNVVANKTTINPNEAVTFTIRTTSTANVVWVTYNNTSTNATGGSPDLTGIRTWTVTIYPSASQQVQIWANTTQTTSNASTVTQTINVYGSSSYITINTASANPPSVNANQAVTLTVITNSAAEYVWSSTDTNLSFNRSYTDPTTGNRTWTATIYPSSSRAVTVHAGRSWGSIEATQTINVVVYDDQNPKIISASPNISYVPINKGIQYITFSIITNTIVTSVQVNSSSTSAYSFTSDGNKLWTLTNVPVQWSGSIDSVGNYENVSVLAHGSSVGTASTTVRFSVQ